MTFPKEVKRVPPVVAKFEGGERDANVIIAWLKANDQDAKWIPASPATEEGSDNPRPATEEHILFNGQGIVPLNHWIAFDGGQFVVGTDRAMAQTYEDVEPPKESFKDFVERHYGKEEASHVYVARELTVKAMQMPTAKENEASKDLEERVRAIAQFIDSEGCTIFQFDISELGFTYEGKNITLKPGEWVVSDFKNRLHFLSHADFRLFYKSAEEA